MENQNQDVTPTPTDVNTARADVTTTPTDVPPAQEGAASTPGKSTSSREDTLAKLVEEIQDPHTKDYVKNRLLDQMKWYSKRSREYKRQYQTLMTCSIILGAMIPVTSLLLKGPLGVQILIAALGAAVTAVNAYLSLNNSRDLWLTYRNTREILLRTLYFYFNNAEKFSSGTEAEKNELLIEVCEAEMARENGTWRSMMEK